MTQITRGFSARLWQSAAILTIAERERLNLC
jgi:hypothetical protein